MSSVGRCCPRISDEVPRDVGCNGNPGIFGLVRADHRVDPEDKSPGQERVWLPQADLIPGAVEAGWVLFETDTDTTKANLQIQLERDLQIQLERNDVRATWE